MMLTTTIENKRYTLEKFHMNYLDDQPASIYVQFIIEVLDGETVLYKYPYGYNISQEMVGVVLYYLQQNFQEPMVNKLLELNA